MQPINTYRLGRIKTSLYDGQTTDFETLVVKLIPIGTDDELDGYVTFSNVRLERPKSNIYDYYVNLSNWELTTFVDAMEGTEIDTARLITSLQNIAKDLKTPDLAASYVDVEYPDSNCSSETISDCLTVAGIRE